MSINNNVVHIEGLEDIDDLSELEVFNAEGKNRKRKIDETVVKKKRANDLKYRRKLKVREDEVKTSLCSFKRSFFAVLPTILPSRRNCSSIAPIFACIQPIRESSVLRVNVGSHNVKFTKKGKAYHQCLDYDLTVPVGCCVLFYYDATIHSGGPATSSCTRIFSIFAEEIQLAPLENKNYTNVITKCEDKKCKICLKAMKYISRNEACLIPELNHEDICKYFNLEDHGFCVLRLKNESDIPNYVKNSVFLLENNFSVENRKSIKFNSIGQEEIKVKGGKRKMMSLEGTGNHDVAPIETLTENVMVKGMNSNLYSYLNDCEQDIIKFLEANFSCKYKRKGRTMIINTGEVSYQRMHIDGIPK